MHALKSLTRQREYSHLQNVVSLLAAAVLRVAALYPTAALAQGQPKPPVFEGPVTFLTDPETGATSPMGLVIAELANLDGPGDDGYPDVAVVNTPEYGKSVTVFRNTGDWSDPAGALERTGVFWLEECKSPYDVKAGHIGDDQGDLPPDDHLDLVISLGRAQGEAEQIRRAGKGRTGEIRDSEAGWCSLRSPKRLWK